MLRSGEVISALCYNPHRYLHTMSTGKSSVASAGNRVAGGTLRFAATVAEPLCFTAWGLRGWEFCPFSPFFANFSTFTKISQVPSFRVHSPVKTVFRKNPKNARKSQNTPSTNPYQNETQFPLSSLKNATSGHARPPKSVLCPPVISGTNSRQNSLKFP